MLTELKSKAGWIAALVLLGVVLGMVLSRGCASHAAPDGDHQTVVDYSDVSLVFVSEKKTPTIDQDLLMRMVPGIVADHKLKDYLWLDEEEEQGVKVAALAGVKPPLVALVRNKEVLRAQPWPTPDKPLLEFLK